MAKLLRSALESEETEKEPQLTDDSDDLLADAPADVELAEDGVPEFGDDLLAGAEDVPHELGGPNDELSLVHEGDLEADGLLELLADADGEPGGGLRSHDVAAGETADDFLSDEYGDERDEVGGISNLREMPVPAKK